MKRLAALIVLLPAMAQAHGVHAPVPETMHGLAHMVPAVVIIVLAIIVGILWRARQ